MPCVHTHDQAMANRLRRLDDMQGGSIRSRLDTWPSAFWKIGTGCSGTGSLPGGKKDPTVTICLLRIPVGHTVVLNKKQRRAFCGVPFASLLRFEACFQVALDALLNAFEMESSEDPPSA